MTQKKEYDNESFEKSISTFSRIIEHEHNQVKELINELTENNNKKLKEIIKGFEYASKQLAYVSNLHLYTPPRLLQENSKRLSNIFKLAAESSNALLLQRLAVPVPAFNALTIFQNSLSSRLNVLKDIEGSFMKLPIDEIHRSLNEIKSVDIDITEFRSYRVPNHEYLLRTTTTETTDLGIFKLRTIQQTQMQIQSLQGDVNEMKQFVLEDGKKKDEMLQELLDYFRNGGTSTVKIQKIKYNKKTAELIIDDKSIGIKADTNQHYLCKILFTSKKSIQRVWEIYDIVEALGEHADSLDGWVKVIYSTVRHLNEKIQFQTGIARFILYDNKTVMVNPKYLDLT